jgi:hypothetical protein
MQESGGTTPQDRLLPLVVAKLKNGTTLHDLVAAAALANARTLGGEDYVGFHAFMALIPAYAMAQQLPKPLQALPVLKVLYRSAECIERMGGRSNEVLRPIAPADLPAGESGADRLREATRRRDMTEAERLFAAIAQHPAEDAFNDLQFPVQEHADVHQVLLAWRAWALLDLAGREHAHTLLRQSVRFNVSRPLPAGMREKNWSLLVELLDSHRLHERPPGMRKAEDHWLERMSETILASSRDQAAQAVAAALAEGFSTEDVGQAISLAANQLVLRMIKNWDDSDRTHGDSLGVHASDSVNAWRNVARVSNPRNAHASLIIAARYVTGQHEPGHFRQDGYPFDEHRERLGVQRPEDLLRAMDTAIRANDQFRACAAVQRYGELGHAPRPVFDLLLRYAISEDGRLHAEKYYQTVAEEFAASRSAFRWRHLTALARVTASQFGYSANDERGEKEGFRAPGYEEARRLLNV